MEGKKSQFLKGATTNSTSGIELEKNGQHCLLARGILDFEDNSFTRSIKDQLERFRRLAKNTYSHFNETTQIDDIEKCLETTTFQNVDLFIIGHGVGTNSHFHGVPFKDGILDEQRIEECIPDNWSLPNGRPSQLHVFNFACHTLKFDDYVGNLNLQYRYGSGAQNPWNTDVQFKDLLARSFFPKGAQSKLNTTVVTNKFGIVPLELLMFKIEHDAKKIQQCAEDPRLAKNSLQDQGINGTYWFPHKSFEDVYAPQEWSDHLESLGITEDTFNTIDEPPMKGVLNISKMSVCFLSKEENERKGCRLAFFLKRVLPTLKERQDFLVELLPCVEFDELRYFHRFQSSYRDKYWSTETKGLIQDERSKCDPTTLQNYEDEHKNKFMRNLQTRANRHIIEAVIYLANLECFTPDWQDIRHAAEIFLVDSGPYSSPLDYEAMVTDIDSAIATSIKNEYHHALPVLERRKGHLKAWMNKEKFENLERDEQAHSLMDDKYPFNDGTEPLALTEKREDQEDLIKAFTSGGNLPGNPARPGIGRLEHQLRYENRVFNLSWRFWKSREKNLDSLEVDDLKSQHIALLDGFPNKFSTDIDNLEKPESEKQRKKFEKAQAALKEVLKNNKEAIFQGDETRTELRNRWDNWNPAA